MKALNILLKNIGKYGFIFLIKLFFFEIFNLYRLRYYDYFIKNPNNKKFQPYIPSPYYNLRFIKNYIEKGSIFIDFGCGTGRVLNYLKKTKSILNLIGFEINEDLKKYNKNLPNNIKIFYINCEDIKFINKRIKLYKKKKLTLFFYHPFGNHLISKIVRNFLKRNYKLTIILVGKININKDLKRYFNKKKINKMMIIYKRKTIF